MRAIIMIDAFDKQKLLAGEELEFEMTDQVKDAKSLVIKLTPNATDQPVGSISNNEFVHDLINKVMEKHDRSVSIYIHPENGMSVNVDPWPDYEDLYEMYKDGKITFNDFRAKAGLPMMKEEDFIRASHRFDIQEIKD